MIINVPRWLLLGFGGAAWLPNINLIANDLTGEARRLVINHENIHQTQQDEIGYPVWAVLYIYFNIRFGYWSNPFEIDAYRWQFVPEKRPSQWWRTVSP
jgi:hypothetical protein